MKRFTLILLIFLTVTLSALSADVERWISMPIYVYIPQYGNYSSYMKKAFLAWEEKSNGNVRFKFVNRPENANIEVEFTDFVTNCNSNHAVGCTQMFYGKRGHYSKAFVTIGTKEYKYERVGSNISRKIVERPFDNIYGVMLHENGHAIGLGHSQSKDSIMYPVDLPTLQYLTNEDLKLLYNKYH